MIKLLYTGMFISDQQTGHDYTYIFSCAWLSNAEQKIWYFEEYG